MRFPCPWLVSLALAGTLLSSCASAEPSLTADEAAADKTWFVSAYEAAGQSATPGRDATAVIDINPALMSVEGAAGCGTFYGSFTLGTTADPAIAGFTIPGRSASDCDSTARGAHDLVIEALEGTTTFRYQDDKLLLTGPGVSVTLIPAG